MEKVESFLTISCLLCFKINFLRTPLILGSQFTPLHVTVLTIFLLAPDRGRFPVGKPVGLLPARGARQ